MKKTLVVMFVVIAFFFLCWFSFRKLNSLEKDSARLYADYDQILRIKGGISLSKEVFDKEDFLKEIGHIIHQSNLNDKVMRIQPRGQQIEVVLQKISQEEMVKFMNTLDGIRSLSVLHVDLSTNASKDLTLSLTLQKHGNGLL